MLFVRVPLLGLRNCFALSSDGSGEDGPRDDEREPPPSGQRRAASARREHERRGEQRDEPDDPAEAQDRERRGARDSEGQDAARGSEVVGERRSDGSDQAQGPCRRDLLDPAPKAVTEEERGLARDGRREGAQRAGAQDRRDERVEGRREQRRQVRHVGLKEPGRVLPGERVADSERKKRADRIPAGEVEGEGRLIRGPREAAEVAPVLHDPVGDREPGRSVVELDVAGERRLPRQDHGGGVEREHPGRGGGGPAVDRSTAPPRKRQGEAEGRERDDERHRELGRRVGESREVGRDHDERQARRRDDRARQPDARDDLEQQTAPEGDERQDEREQDPAGEHRHRLSSRERRPAGRARAGTLSGSA